MSILNFFMVFVRFMILRTYNSFNLFFGVHACSRFGFVAYVETRIVLQNNATRMWTRGVGGVWSFKTLLLLYTEDCRLLSVWCRSCFHQPLVYLVKSHLESVSPIDGCFWLTQFLWFVSSFAFCLHQKLLSIFFLKLKIIIFQIQQIYRCWHMYILVHSPLWNKGTHILHQKIKSVNIVGVL